MSSIIDALGHRDIAKIIADRILDGNAVMHVFGPSGSGKTGLAAEVAADLKVRNVSSLYVAGDSDSAGTSFLAIRRALHKQGFLRGKREKIDVTEAARDIPGIGNTVSAILKMIAATNEGIGPSYLSEEQQEILSTIEHLFLKRKLCIIVDDLHILDPT